MRTLLRSIRIGWVFLFHPRKAGDEIGSSANALKLSLVFLALCEGSWTSQNAYVKIVLKQTPRMRECLFGLKIDIETLTIFLLISTAIATVAFISYITSLVARRLGGTAQFKRTVCILAITLNSGSIFIDYPHELGWTLTGAPWEFWECVPNFAY